MSKTVRITADETLTLADVPEIPNGMSIGDWLKTLTPQQREILKSEYASTSRNKYDYGNLTTEAERRKFRRDKRNENPDYVAKRKMRSENRRLANKILVAQAQKIVNSK